MQLFLIGMPGCGKTSLGRKISDILDLPFVDLDEEIEKSHNKKISSIFSEYGESFFRDLESETLLKFKEFKGIVSTGGGIILRESNRNLLQSVNTLYIHDSVDNLLKRIDISARPLLKDNPDKLNDLYESRKEFYNLFKKIDITGLNEWESVSKILYAVADKKDVYFDEKVHKIGIKYGCFGEIKKDGFSFTSHSVDRIYSEFLSTNKFIFPDGEICKSPEYVFKGYDFLLDNDLSRSDKVSCIGGGTISDLSGFICSTFKRGIKYDLYPTTTLSQIDASVGGKNGFDYKGYKNIIGTINFPDNVVIDPLSVYSLDDELFLEGFVEAFKMSLITGNCFEEFKNNFDLINKRNLKFYTDNLVSSINDKIDIVLKDPYDRGIRSLLNLGHTLGHAYESYKGVRHGTAVAWGLKNELYAFYKMGFLNKNIYNNVVEILYGFVDNKILDDNIDINYLKEYIFKDKKINKNNKILIPVFYDIGNTKVDNIDLFSMLLFF